MPHKTVDDNKGIPRGIRVGGEIEARCNRCKEETDHVILAMLDERPVRIMCKRCKSQHNHKPPKEAGEKPRASARKPARKRPGKTDGFARLLAGRDPASAVPYDRARRFEPNQLMLHPSFGLGVVVELKAGTKVVVCFEGGERTLLHQASTREVPT